MIRFQATIAALAIGVMISLASPAAADNVLRFKPLARVGVPDEQR